MHNNIHRLLQSRNLKIAESKANLVIDNYSLLVIEQSAACGARQRAESPHLTQHGVVYVRLKLGVLEQSLAKPGFLTASTGRVARPAALQFAGKRSFVAWG